MSVSVHIVTYNNEKDIKLCIESVIAQSYHIDQVIIIDNNSSDTTKEKIRYVINRQTNCSCILVENTNNIGFAAAHNQAINMSESEYVFILNPDVILHLDYVQSVLKELCNNLNVGSATGKLLYIECPDTIDSTGLVIHKNRRVFERGANEIDLGQWDERTDVFGVSAAAAIYRRKMLEEVMINKEVFDETFFIYKEDVDLAWRARLLGWDSVFVPKALAYHKRGWGYKQKRRDIPLVVRKHSYINRYYTIFKNDNFWKLMIHIPYVLLYEIMSLSYIIVKERDVLVTWKWFAKNYRQMKVKRTWIKKNKIEVVSNRIYEYFQ